MHAGEEADAPACSLVMLMAMAATAGTVSSDGRQARPPCACMRAPCRHGMCGRQGRMRPATQLPGCLSRLSGMIAATLLHTSPCSRRMPESLTLYVPDATTGQVQQVASSLPSAFVVHLFTAWSLLVLHKYSATLRKMLSPYLPTHSSSQCGPRTFVHGRIIMHTMSSLCLRDKLVIFNCSRQGYSAT